eukprot:scaffold12111_cov66-Phaeocystis_antarctica.AAC.1
MRWPAGDGPPKAPQQCRPQETVFEGFVQRECPNQQSRLATVKKKRACPLPRDMHMGLHQATARRARRQPRRRARCPVAAPNPNMKPIPKPKAEPEAKLKPNP